jgi:hypothetical protein
VQGLRQIEPAASISGTEIATIADIVEKKFAYLARNWMFESGSLQWRVKRTPGVVTAA